MGGHTVTDLQPADTTSLFITEEMPAKTDIGFSAPKGDKGKIVD